jgi:hypothetical protein
MLPALLFLGLLVLFCAVHRERRSRRAFAEDGPAFACRIRAPGRSPASWPRLRRRWSRQLYARWFGAVLVVRRGPVFDRTVRIAAAVTMEGVVGVPGTNAIVVRLWVSDGSLVEVTAGAQARTELVGMYLAAAVSDLPRAPLRRREI